MPPDTDHDGMSDTWELANGLVVGVTDAFLDKDGNGLLNIQKYYLETNPSSTDSDGDSFTNFAEFAFGLDPLAFRSSPPR